MSLKIVMFCVQMCLIKTSFAQCLGPRPGFIDGLGPLGIPARFESSLLLENYPMPTPGLSIVADDLIIEGLISVSGSLPFLGTVALEGLLPTEGQGKVVYGCGNGDVGIMGENTGPYGPGFPGPLAGPIAGPFGGPLPGPMAGPFAGPFGPLAGPIAPAFAGPMPPAFAPFASPCNLGPIIDPGMAAAANTAALAAAANSAGQAAVMTSVGLGATANVAGLTAMAGF